jgi:hypothetical protein
MGLGDCDAQAVRLNVNIFTLYANYVNEFDFDPNFHSNISEVKLSSCKSNCPCQTFLAFLPVTTNAKPQSAAIHYMNKDNVLEAADYTCPYGMLVEQGSSLTVKPNVTIEFLPNTKILVLEKMDLKSKLNQEVYLKLVQISCL